MISRWVGRGAAALWLAPLGALASGFGGHLGGGPASLGPGPAAYPSTSKKQTCRFEVEASRFVESLALFRGGDLGAKETLFESAERLSAECGRHDPQATARFYASLSDQERRAGLDA